MKKQGHRNCRYCNYRLRAKDARCPACKRSQSHILEYLALLFGICVLALVTYLQLYVPSLLSEPFDTPQDTAPQATDSLATPTTAEPTPRTTHSFFWNRPLQPTEPAQPNTPRPQVSSLTPHPPKSSRYKGTKFLQQSGKYPFYVATKRWDSEKAAYQFYRTGMQGAEIPLRGDPRRYFVSENQTDYPEPDSGCGPTALLNLYIWYSKFGLLDESITHANLQTYKRLKFKQIDRKLLEIQRQSRTRNGGTNTLAAIVAMDELIQQYSGDKNLRLHFEIKKPPLAQSDFTELSRNYRVGLLSVRPKDKRTGKLLSNHAVLCIRGDTSGMITIANWGEFSHGRLVNRPDGQWFIPSAPADHELRINNLTTLIPFTPKS